AEEARSEPFLRLAAIAAAPHLPNELFREIVEQPVPGLGHDFGIGRADFLLEFAEGCRARLLAPVDAALRHLPGLVQRVAPPGDEDLALAVEQHHAHPAPVADRRLDAARPDHDPPLVTALTGAATKPLPSKLFIQGTMRASVTG